MAEHHPEPAQQLPGQTEALRCVTLPAIPTVYGLEDPEEGVRAWVFALPDGQALIVPSEGEGTGLISTNMEKIINWRAPFWGVELVLVTT